jgi:hypothetical protein
VDAGCEVAKVEEHGEGREDGDFARWIPSALPLYLLLAGRKRESEGTARFDIAVGGTSRV